MARLHLRLRAEIRQANRLHAGQVEARDVVRSDGRSRPMLGGLPFERQRMREHPGGQRVDLPLAADADRERHAVRRTPGRRRVLLFQLFDQRLHATHDAQPVLGGRIAGMVGGRHAQHRQADFAVERRDLAVDRLLGRQLDGFLDVVRQQPLVDAGRRVERGLAAEQHVQELQSRQVSADHQQADGERRRHDQADRAPQRRPENSRHHQRYRRQPGARAVKPRLDDVVADHLQHHDQADGPQHHAPARVHRKRQRQREYRRDHRPDIGHEAHHRRDGAPEQRLAPR